MSNCLEMLRTLRRPRLLIQAAQIGAAAYRRDIHMRKHIEAGAAPCPADLLIQLIDLEADLNDRRLQGEASYSVSDHVDILAARLLCAAHPSTVKAFLHFVESRQNVETRVMNDC